MSGVVSSNRAGLMFAVIGLQFSINWTLLWQFRTIGEFSTVVTFTYGLILLCIRLFTCMLLLEKQVKEM